MTAKNTRLSPVLYSALIVFVIIQRLKFSISMSIMKNKHGRGYIVMPTVSYESNDCITGIFLLYRVCSDSFIMRLWKMYTQVFTYELEMATWTKIHTFDRSVKCYPRCARFASTWLTVCTHRNGCISAREKDIPIICMLKIIFSMREVWKV